MNSSQADVAPQETATVLLVGVEGEGGVEEASWALREVASREYLRGKRERDKRVRELARKALVNNQRKGRWK